MTTQQRAKAGGELGANGEWYEGGKFIATKDNPKSAPPLRTLLAPDPARMAADEARTASIQQWLERRRAELADVIDVLTQCPEGYDAAVWAQRVADHAAGFEASLGRTLWVQGCLSRKQAEAAVRVVYGRRNRRIEDAWDERVQCLMQDWVE